MTKLPPDRAPVAESPTNLAVVQEGPRKSRSLPSNRETPHDTYHRIVIPQRLMVVRESTEDLNAIPDQLRALTGILGLLGRTISPTTQTLLSENVVREIRNAFDVCENVAQQVLDNVRKYRRDKLWAKMTWAMFGQKDSQKLRQRVSRTTR
ncbi:hypothetical protein B0H67DRAFT_556494 [Lasiosphaeris hirsuta]|uniref:Uncharacterized protein n=1 Tax=Lasiosphaeris hirsuta TaxID=260670 RepID=A0AA40A2B2_9PEZI|nr:hypothetical protein B0H67DRAFT_556494 [Lasiosphaeris hirsuta]